MPADVTILILTKDEEDNLPRALASVAGWAARVVVVDSGSRDRTIEIARAAGADGAAARKVFRAGGRVCGVRRAREGVAEQVLCSRSRVAWRAYGTQHRAMARATGCMHGR